MLAVEDSEVLDPIYAAEDIDLVIDIDNPDITPRELREGAPVLDISQEEYDEMLNAESYVQVICPDGRIGVEIVMADPFKDPCFVRGDLK